MIYYGSTIRKLNTRLKEHLSGFEKWLENKEETNFSSYRIFEKYGTDGCSIILVEDYPCNSKEELHKREGQYILENNCVNKCVAGKSEMKKENENFDLIAKRNWNNKVARWNDNLDENVAKKRKEKEFFEKYQELKTKLCNKEITSEEFKKLLKEAKN